MDSATILFFKCQKRDYTFVSKCQDTILAIEEKSCDRILIYFIFFDLFCRVFDTCSIIKSLQAAEMRHSFVKFYLLFRCTGLYLHRKYDIMKYET